MGAEGHFLGGVSELPPRPQRRARHGKPIGQLCGSGLRDSTLAGVVRMAQHLQVQLLPAVTPAVRPPEPSRLTEATAHGRQVTHCSNTL